MSSSPCAAGAVLSTAASASTSAPSFASFVLERVSRNPFLIGETPWSLRPPPPHPEATSASPPAQHVAKSPRDATEDASSLPSTLDPAQRAVIAQACIAGTAATSNPASTLAVTAVLQRALIDAPLLPVGGCHLLHELVWPHFLASAEAAKQVFCYRKALQLCDARQAQPTTDSNVPLPEQKPPQSSHCTEVTSSTSDGELEKKANGAAVDLFAASPLAVSSTDDQQWSNQGAGALPSSGAASLLQTPEELSLSSARDVLQARMGEALTRLAASREELQRGLTKLRQRLDGLHAYDAVPFAELAQQQEETMRSLFTPATLAVAGSSAKENSDTRRRNVLLTADAAAAAASVARGASAVLGEADAVTDRKRLREP
ncbi:hypothetical protein MNV84_00447 [Leishmania braziliensis]|nr:hypothetical protein MNV84_00447 [Leishmania braziliensis]